MLRSGRPQQLRPRTSPALRARVPSLVVAALAASTFASASTGCGTGAARGPDAAPCVGESDAVLCARIGRQCGPESLVDGCGAQRTIACGDCAAATMRCDAFGQCVACAPETDEAFCRRVNRACGPVGDLDNCGHPREADCGTCPDPWTCDGAVGACTCVAEPDEVFCGTRVCGPARGLDRCGRQHDVESCGECASTETCVDGACKLCVAETDEEFCAAQQRACGSASGVDSCGTPRAVASCGACGASNEACDPSGRCRVLGDSCAFAQVLAFDVHGRASAHADLSTPDATTAGSCGNGQGPDVVFEFRLASEKVVEAVVEPAALSAALRPSLYLRSGCDQPETEVACNTSEIPGSVKLVTRLPAGSWFLWADSNAMGMNAVTVTLTASDPQPPPVNDRCAQAAPLPVPTAEGTSISVTGTTLGAGDDASDACGGAGGGADVVYTFALDTAADITVRVQPQDWNAVLYLRTGCADGPASPDGTTLACRDLSGPGPLPAGAETVTLRGAAAGVYSVWIDGVARDDQGVYTLELTRNPPSPVARNDACAYPEPLGITATTTSVAVIGDSRGASDDTSSTCGASDGPDLVYALHLDKDASVQMTVTVDPTTPLLMPALYVRRACAAAQTEVACGQTRTRTLQVNAPHLAPGDYSVIVDGTAGTAGLFTLQVDVGAPTFNDLCTTPQLMLFDPVTGIATARGDTRPALPNIIGRCSPDSGRDLVYKITLTAPSALEVTATPLLASALAPQVYLRSECSSGPSEIGCALAPVGQPATLAVSRVWADTWYIIVDSTSPQSAGPFDLVIQAKPIPPPPANDTCASLQLLTFDPTTHSVTVAGTTAGAVNDYNASCGGAFGGSDVVYAFDVSGSATAVRADVATLKTGYQPVVYVRSDCASGATADEIACAQGVDSAAALVTPLLQPGRRYYLIVDGVFPADGAYTMTLSQVPALPDGCANPQPLAVVPGQTTAVQGDTRVARNDAESVGCGPTPGRDLVYEFTTPRALNLLARMSWSDPLRQGALYLRRAACASASASSEVACAKPPATAAQATSTALVARALPAGTYWLWVDAVQSSSLRQGPFTLELTVSDPPAAPANDACADAAALAFVSGVARASGDLSGAADDAAGSCGGGGSGTGGPDAVYEIVVPGPGAQSLRAQVITAATPGFEPVLYLRSGTCTSTSSLQERACASGAAVAAIAVDSLAAGTYWLFVDSRGAAGGPFDLEVSLDAPASLPDACASSTTLALNPANHLVVRGDTSQATDDTKSLGCLDGFGSDVVYTIDTTALGTRHDLVASLVFDDPTMTPVIYLRTVCSTRLASDEIACAVGGTGQGTTATIVQRGLAAGVYFLWIDSLWYGGAFTLDLQVPPTPAAPANDGCAGAIALDLTSGNASATGVLTWAQDDATGTCAGVGAAGGRDVVYTFTTSQTRKLTATATADSGSPALAPRVYLRQSCSGAQASNEITCAAAPSSSGAGQSSATAVVNALPVGTYYLWVDASDAANEGGFTLEVATDAPVAGPANESCATATALGALSFTTPMTIVGTTAGAQSEAEGGCSAPGAPDVVYEFSLAQARRILATVTPTAAGFVPAIRLRPAMCDNLAGETCVAAAAAGRAAMAFAESAPAGTYYVWIDSGGPQSLATAGGFELTLETADPNSPPANDNCGAGAVALTRGVAVRGSTVGAVNDYPGPLNATACRGLSVGGRDVVYTYTPATSGPFEVVVIAAEPFTPVVWVSQAVCGDASACIAVTDFADFDDGYRIAVNGAAGTSYAIVVDAAQWAMYGMFTVEVK